MPLGSSSDCRLDRTYWLPGVEGPELPWEAGRLSELADDIRALSKGVQCSDRSDGGVGQAVQRVYIEVLYARCRDGQGQVCGCRLPSFVPSIECDGGRPDDRRKGHAGAT